MPTGTEAFDKPDVRAVAEAIQVPHSHVCLCEVQGDPVRNLVGITRLGMHALATNTVRQHLRLGDATPTA
jgi:hypothetical protein